MAITRNTVGSLTAVNSATPSFSIPTNAVNDVLVLFLATGGTVSSGPAGWTLVGSITTVAAAKLYVWTLPVSSVQSGSVTVTLSASATNRGVIISYSGMSLTATPTFVTSSSTTATTTVSAPSQTYGDFVVWVNGRDGSSTLSGSADSSGTWSSSSAFENSGTNAITVYDGAIPMGTTASLSATSSTARAWNSMAIVFVEPSIGYSGTAAFSGSGTLSAGSPTVMTLLAHEEWTGTNGAAWPSQWTTIKGTATIASNAGKFDPGSGSFADGRVDLTGMSAVTDTDVVVTLQPAVSGIQQGAFVGVNSDGGGTTAIPNNCYIAQVDYAASPASSDIKLITVASGGQTTRATLTKTIDAAVPNKIRVQRIGQVIRAKTWAASAGEPTTWDVTYTITGTPLTGKVFLGYYKDSAVVSGHTMSYDDLEVTTDITAYAASPSFSGTGTLTTSVTPTPKQSASFSGTGTLTATGMVVQLVMFGGTGTLRTGAPTITRTNLAPNPTSETVPWALGSVSGTGAAVALSTAWSYVGSASTALTKGSGYTYVAVGGGTGYPGAAPVGVTRWWGVMAMASADTTVRFARRGASYTTVQYTLTANVPRWITASWVGDGTTDVKFELGWEAADGTAGTVLYMDAALIEDRTIAPAASDYFDGDTAGDATHTYTWTGAPNSSTSTQTTFANVGTPGVSRSPSFSGTGTLTTSGTPKPAVSTSFSGTGTLSTSGAKPAVGQTTSFSGTGTLTTAVKPTPKQSVSFSGTGTLITVGKAWLDPSYVGHVNDKYLKYMRWGDVPITTVYQGDTQLYPRAS